MHTEGLIKLTAMRMHNTDLYNSGYITLHLKTCEYKGCFQRQNHDHAVEMFRNIFILIHSIVR